MTDDVKPKVLEGELVPASRGRGRLKGYTHTERARQRIKTGWVLHCLHEHLAGRMPLRDTQIAAARILLAKTVPDLRAVEHTGEVNHNHLTRFSDAELEAILERERRDGTPAAPAGALESPPVH